MPRPPSKPPRTPRGDGPSLTRPPKPPAARTGGVSPQGFAPPRKTGGGSGKGGKGGGRGGKIKARREPLWARVLRMLLTKRGLATIGSVLLTFFILGLVGLGYFAHDLPDISKLTDPHRSLGIQVLAADGELIKNYGDIYGEQLAYKDFPKPLVNAVVATEDRKFFYHFGIDPLGILRAMVVNTIHGHVVQGGSTITQQLAKNVFLTPEQTLKRKLQEMLLALWLESRYSKQQILSIYLNRVYLGAGNYGVDAAARHYFGKSARQLDLPESALIAGLLKAPSRYSPTADIDLARRRAHQVLLNMVDAGSLKKKDAETAFTHFTIPQNLATSEGRSGRYFADWVVDQLPDVLPNLQDDIIIQTTLEPRMQIAAEQALDEVLTPEEMQKARISQTALLSMRPNGAIVAMIGGRDYAKSQYNRATQAKRQPGSSFKMFVYLTAMENGFSPDQMVDDHPITISTSSGPWSPHNYENKYFGTIPLRKAVAESLNTVAVQVSRQVGLDNVINTARRLGVTSDLDLVASLALGSTEVTLLEMTGAYAHLASGGMGVRPYGIAQIHRKSDGQLMFERRDTGAYLVIAHRAVTAMNSMLEGVITGGTGTRAAIGRPAAGKTGTTSDYKDAWFIGYTADLATGVWMGNDDNSPTGKITGGKLPAAVWAAYMKKAEDGVPIVPLPVDYGGGNAPLPWLTPAPATSSEPVPFGNPTPPPRPTTDDSLEPTFWNKLFDGGKVEYTYPSQRRH